MQTVVRTLYVLGALYLASLFMSTCYLADRHKDRQDPPPTPHGEHGADKGEHSHDGKKHSHGAKGEHGKKNEAEH